MDILGLVKALLQKTKLVIDRALSLGVLRRTRHVRLKGVHQFLMGIVVHHGVLQV